MSHTVDGKRGDQAEPVHTVTLSERDRRAAARILNALVGQTPKSGGESASLFQASVQDLGNPHDRSVLVERARRAFVDRARRSQNFNRDMFGEAAWDMLLALYVAEHSQARTTVSELVKHSGVPATTALRWLDFLEVQEQLVTRSQSTMDKRVYRITLTDKAREALDWYFSGTSATAR